MSKPIYRMSPTLEIEQLEAGLRMFDQADFEPAAFWDDNVATFKQTLLVALRETTDALASNGIRVGRRADLKEQIKALQRFVELADRYVAMRAYRSSHRNQIQ
jgi:hypothetical protein